MDHVEKILAFYVLAIILVIATLVPTLMYFDNKETDAEDAIVERQVEEGTQYTAVVEAYDLTNELLIMDNGHEIDASELSSQPDAGDVLSYIKTFDYEISKWNSMPKETDETAYVNIKIMN